MAKIPGQLEEAQLHNLSSDPSNLPDGKIWLNTTANRFKTYLQAAIRTLVTEDQTQTLTNKTIDDDNNVIQNVELSALKTILGDASKFIVRDVAGAVVSDKAVPAGNVVGTGANNTFTASNIFQGLVSGDIEADTTAGADQTLSTPTKLVKRSTGALTSIAGFTAPASAVFFVWKNVTGGEVIIKNNAVATAANRIITGTTGDLAIKNNASVWFVYDVTSSRWRVIGGSSGGGALRAASVAISNAVDSVTVTFSSAVQNTNYIPIFSFTNTTDADPIFLQGFVSAKTVNGFTVKFNVATDSANYVMEYTANETV